MSRRRTRLLKVRLASALALIGLASRVLAEVDVVAEYRLGASTAQITYTGGPETMADASGKNHALKREGNPRFMASAPSVPSAQGAGALEFNGTNDAYVRTNFNAKNTYKFDAGFVAGAAIAGDALILRTKSRLYCVSNGDTIAAK